MNTEAAPVSEFPLVASIAIDAILVLSCLALKVFLLGGLAKFASRGEAEIKPKPTIIVTLVIVSFTYLFTVSPDGVIGIYFFFVVAFIGTFICKKVFWIEIDKALITSFLFVFLSISLTDYSSRGMNLLIPTRTSLEGAVAGAIDQRTREKTGDDTLPASHRILPAIGQYSADPSEDGKESILDTFLTPIRMGQKAKRQIAEIDKVAAEQASIVNMLSGAGTNVGDRAEELAALKQGMMDEAAGKTQSAATQPVAASGFDASQSYEAPPETEAAPAPLDPEEPVEPPPPEEKEPPRKGSTFAESVALAIINIVAKLRGEDPDAEAPSGDIYRAMRLVKQKQHGEAAAQSAETNNTQTAVTPPTQQVTPDAPSKKVGDLAMVNTARGKKSAKRSAPTKPRPAAPVKPKKTSKKSMTEKPIKDTGATAQRANSIAEKPKTTTRSEASPNADTPKTTVSESKPVGPLAKLDALDPEKRKLWKKAHSSIRVSGTGWSAEGAYALVRGKFLRVGASISIRFEKQDFPFKLAGINDTGVCKWEPVVKNVDPDNPDVFLPF